MNFFEKNANLFIWIGVSLFFYNLLKPLIFNISTKEAFISAGVSLVLVFIGLIFKEMKK